MARSLLSGLLAGMLLLAGGCAARPAPPHPVAAVAAQTQPTDGVPPATDVSPRDIVPYLASDRLEGRGVGEQGLDQAADFIARDFTAAGLQPLPSLGNYFQPFTYTTTKALGPETSLKIGDKPLTLGKDYEPLRGSGEQHFDGPVAFVGYGIIAPEAGYDDYAGIDVAGKVVIAYRFEPLDAHGVSQLKPTGQPGQWSDHATFREKVAAAAQHHAAALLVVNPPEVTDDSLIHFSTDVGLRDAPIPVMQITQAVADRIRGGPVQPHGTGATQPDAASRPIEISGRVDALGSKIKVRNVVGCVRGVGPYADQYVVIGAHYDHLGRGQLGGNLGPVGSIYHGADDNASGAATIIELASRFAHGQPPPRTLVFICFTAEEEGLIGSEYFVNHPPIPLTSIVAMLNLDMVGRLRDNTLYVGGEGTAKDFDAIVAAAQARSALHLKSIGRGGFGPTDHMSFALKHIPVLFFFTGLHADYHRPSDTADKVNYPGIEAVANFTADVIDGLERMPNDPYIASADKESMHLFGMTSGGGISAGRRVILGIIPDFGSEDSRVGVLIAGTTPDTPAAKAGLQGGDLLVRFGDQKLEDLMDLSTALARSKPGDKVDIEILRGKTSMTFHVTLAERKD